MAKGFLSRITYNNWLWVFGLLSLLLSVLFIPLTSGNFAGISSAFLRLDLLPGCEGLFKGLSDKSSTPLLYHFSSMVMIVIGGVLVQHLSSNRRLIRVRSFFPFFWYCVLAASFIPHVEHSGTFTAAALLIGAIYRVFSATEKKEMNRSIFDGSLLLALASILMYRLVWMLPFFWLAAANIQSLNIRNICASLIGFTSVYWIIAGISFLYGDYRFLLNWVENSLTFSLMDFSALSPVAIAYLFFMGLLLLISFGTFVQQQNQDKLLTRKNLYGVLMLWVGFFGLWLTSPVPNTDFLFLQMIPTLIYFAHFFSLNDRLFTRVLFFIQLTLSILSYFHFQ